MSTARKYPLCLVCVLQQILFSFLKRLHSVYVLAQIPFDVSQKNHQPTDSVHRARQIFLR